MGEAGKQIPAIVVGTGFGCRVHVPALRVAGFDVVALVGTRRERLERKADEAGIAGRFTDLDTAIRETGAKAVTIATPPASHAALTLKAIAAGCHVLCEKPLALDASQAAELVAAAERAGVVNMVAHEFRWQPERRLFGRAIAEGSIGEPRFLVLDQFLPLCAAPEARLPSWWFDQDAGGGWLGAGGSHLLDQIRVWIGEFRSLSANLFQVSERQTDTETSIRDHAEDSYSIRFLMEHGVEGSLQQSAGAWGAPFTLWRCAGTRGTLWLENGKVMLADRSGTRELPMPADLLLGDLAPFSPRSPEVAPFARLCQAFRRAIEQGEQDTDPPPATFRDGLAVMQVMDAMRRSSTSGGALSEPYRACSGNNAPPLPLIR